MNINLYLKSSILKKSTSLSKTRLNEAVSANLLQQLGSLKDTFDTFFLKNNCTLLQQAHHTHYC